MEDYATLNEYSQEENLKYFTIGTLVSQVIIFLLLLFMQGVLIYFILP